MILKETVNFARRLAAQGTLGPEEIIQSAVDSALENQPLDLELERQIKQTLRHQLLGYGQLQPLLDDSSVEEIWINDPTKVHIARQGVSGSLPISISPEELRVIIERMLRSSGRRLDRSAPFVDASLPDGSRLHVAIPDITRLYWSVNIRKFPNQIIDLKELEARTSISGFQHEYLLGAVQSGKNILVSGATQAGKTTILCALLNSVPPNQRIVSVEETFEIRLDHADWVGLQTRQPNLEGLGEVTLRRLVKEALRMRPDRLVVGEVREAESLDLLIALNSGLPGACTIHANSAHDAITKLCTLPLLAGQNISSDFVRPTVGTCIDVVVHCKLNTDGSRSVSEIIEVNWNSKTEQIIFNQIVENALV
jgi:pilus assembly protein CpaF